jgi:hypothetical protein
VLWSFRKIKPNRAKRNISNEVVYEKKKYTRRTQPSRGKRGGGIDEPVLVLLSSPGHITHVWQYKCKYT